jgi:hypothetical protein
MAMTHASRPSATALNPTLYAFLQHKFRDVRFANQGSSAVVQRIQDPLNPKRTLTNAQQWGEYYCVCCPFCNDVGNKLWINYLYGADYNPKSGRRTDTHLAICYKNNCIESPERREQLEDLIFGPGRHLLAKVPIQAGDTTIGPQQISVPGKIVNLLELADTAPAVEYLTGRNFDIELLTNVFGVGVCTEPYPQYRLMRGRIYIPSYFNQQLVAWQGRLPTTQKVDMKYYTAGSKSRTLYNYDLACRQECVVIVEGAPSVWRLGAIGVSLFGKTLSSWQENTITTTWTGKPVFVVLDKGEEAAIEKATMQLCRHNLQVIPVLMPDERDPADYSKQDLRDLLLAAADSVGVSVTLSSLR